MQDKDSTRSSINKRMNVVHRCIRTPNIVLRALRGNRRSRSIRAVLIAVTGYIVLLEPLLPLFVKIAYKVLVPACGFRVSESASLILAA